MPIDPGGHIAAESNTQFDMLTAGQMEMWTLQMEQPDSDRYHVPLLYEIEGHKTLQLLIESVDEAFRRIPAIASTYHDDARGMRRLPTGRSYSWNEPIEASLQFEDGIAQFISKPFDLSRSVARFAIAERSGASYICLVIHHIAIDDTSVKHLVDEIASCLNKIELDRDPAPSAEIVSDDNTDHAGLEDDSLAYWAANLADLPDCDFPPAVVGNTGMAALNTDFNIPSTTVDGMRSWSQSNRVSLYSSVFAAFRVSLYLWTNQRDVAIGTLLEIPSPLMDGLSGSKIHTTAIRVPVSTESTLTSVARATGRKIMEATDYSWASFATIVNSLGISKTWGKNQVFQVGFYWEKNDGRSIVHLSKTCRLRRRYVTTRDSKLDMELTIIDLSEHTKVALKVNSQRVDLLALKRFESIFKVVLDNFAQESSTHVGDLVGRLSGTELRSSEIFGKYTEDIGVPLVKLLTAEAQQHWYSCAIVCDGESKTYGQLLAYALNVTELLRRNGVMHGDRVAILAPRNIVYAPALLGILLHGCVFVPIDHRDPGARIKMKLATADVKAALVDAVDDRRYTLDMDESEIFTLVLPEPESVNSANQYDVLEKVSGTWASVRSDDLAFVQFTSGTTGRPKAVGVRQSSVSVRIQDIVRRIDVSESDVILQFASFTFDAAYEQLFAGWAAGASVVMRSDSEWLPSNILGLILDHKVSYAEFTPSYFRQLWEEIKRQKPDVQLSLRILGLGGEAVHKGDIEDWFSHTEIPVIITYGPTETTMSSTALFVDKHVKCEPSVGYALANTDLKVVDEHGSPVFLGTPGELWIGGDGVAEGYVNDDEGTASKFVLTSTGRFYKTGDRVLMGDTGEVWFLGRMDSQIKIDGQRIDPGEIEHVIRNLGTVADCAVNPVSLSEGSEVQGLAAFCVPKLGATLSEEQLRSQLALVLPRHMVPGYFVFLDSMPTSRSGKVDRQILNNQLIQRTTAEVDDVVAWKPLEREVSTIFTESLSLPVPLNPDQDFFANGGTSLAAVRVTRTFASLTDTPISVGDLYANPTVSEFANWLADMEQKLARDGKANR